MKFLYFILALCFGLCAAGWRGGTTPTMPKTQDKGKLLRACRLACISKYLAETPGTYYPHIDENNACQCKKDDPRNRG